MTIVERPRLTFACKLEGDALRTLVADPVVIDDLLALQATVAVGLPDLSPERAEGVRRLNAVDPCGRLAAAAEGPGPGWLHAGNAPPLPHGMLSSAHGRPSRALPGPAWAWTSRPTMRKCRR